MLKNEQFIENRVFSEGTEMGEPSDKTAKPTLSRVDMYKQALTEGLKAMEFFIPRQQEGGVLVAMKKSEYDRDLPHIIGSEAFLRDEFLGIGGIYGDTAWYEPPKPPEPEAPPEAAAANTAEPAESASGGEEDFSWIERQVSVRLCGNLEYRDPDEEIGKDELISLLKCTSDSQADDVIDYLSEKDGATSVTVMQLNEFLHDYIKNPPRVPPPAPQPVAKEKSEWSSDEEGADDLGDMISSKIKEQARRKSTARDQPSMFEEDDSDDMWGAKPASSGTKKGTAFLDSDDDDDDSMFGASAKPKKPSNPRAAMKKQMIRWHQGKTSH
eukprot:TRINITY_DN1641_c0_g1_i1.p1 TRINITY_DN1641_c0_g1~~TRINITY_DN1641_c0_g1_i1.p1  ORF type:complete len:326 (+),score=83.06 TRINITY_DN1641_c0_g1_i1:251-1228(+)